MVRIETDMIVNRINFYHNNLRQINHHHINYHIIHHQDVLYEISNIKISLMR